MNIDHHIKKMKLFQDLTECLEYLSKSELNDELNFVNSMVECVVNYLNKKICSKDRDAEDTLDGYKEEESSKTDIDEEEIVLEPYNLEVFTENEKLNIETNMNGKDQTDERMIMEN